MQNEAMARARIGKGIGATANKRNHNAAYSTEGAQQVFVQCSNALSNDLPGVDWGAGDSFEKKQVETYYWPLSMAFKSSACC